MIGRIEAIIPEFGRTSLSPQQYEVLRAVTAAIELGREQLREAAARATEPDKKHEDFRHAWCAYLQSAPATCPGALKHATQEAEELREKVASLMRQRENTAHSYTTLFRPIHAAHQAEVAELRQEVESLRARVLHAEGATSLPDSLSAVAAAAAAAATGHSIINLVSQLSPPPQEGSSGRVRADEHTVNGLCTAELSPQPFPLYQKRYNRYMAAIGDMSGM